MSRNSSVNNNNNRVNVKISVFGSNGIGKEFLPTMLPQVIEKLNNPNIKITENDPFIWAKLPNNNKMLREKWLGVNAYQPINTRFLNQRLLHQIIAAFIVVDLSDKSSLNVIDEWFKSVERYANEVPIVVVGMRTNGKAEHVTESMLLELRYSYQYIIHHYITSSDDPYRFVKFQYALSCALERRSPPLFTIPPQDCKLPLNMLKRNYQDNTNNNNNNNNINNNNKVSHELVNGNRDRVFKSIIGNKTLMTSIWNQVKGIHKQRHLKVENHVSFLVKNGYYAIAMWKLKKGDRLGFDLNSDVQQYPDSFFQLLRCNNNLELFKLVFKEIQDSYKSSATNYRPHYFPSSPCFKSTIMDECIIGGSMDIIGLLASNDYKPSIRGLRLSILYGDVEMVSYLIEKVLKKSTGKSNKSTTLLKSYEEAPLDEKIALSVTLQRFEGYQKDFLTTTSLETILQPLKYYTPHENQQLIQLSEMYGRLDIKNYLTNHVFTTKNTLLSKLVTTVLK